MLLLVVGLSGFHAPLGSRTRHRHGPLLSAADEYEIRPAKGNEEQMAEAAEFFVDGFWLAGTTTGAVELSGSERAQLNKLSTDDMMGRYGELVGQRRPELTRTPRGLRWVRTGYAYQPPALATYRTHRAACPQGPTYSTYGVRVPASGVGYVPRTVATQAAAAVEAVCGARQRGRAGGLRGRGGGDDRHGGPARAHARAGRGALRPGVRRDGWRREP